MITAEVRLWGKTIGAVSWSDDAGLGRFEYAPDFLDSGIEVAPLTMPLGDRIYSFPALPRETFHGLPGLLADSLPDDFGNALIEAWLAQSGRPGGSLNPVERLCYTGDRGMGALEFYPTQGPSATTSEKVDVAALTDLAGKILAQRGRLDVSLESPTREDSLRQILRVGTSAGGARAKAIIAWNEESNEVRSGQVAAGQGFTYWLLKFDGVSGSQDRGRQLTDPQGYGLVEYAYHQMALAAGITMMPCRLLRENGRSHFMTRRFDRDDKGRKIHLQSLGAMAHYDYRQAGAHSYEQALHCLRSLDMTMDSLEEQFRRMAFNIIARNQDDHVKNIAFLMDKGGTWSLSPAYDVTYSYNPDGLWTGQHQMSLNGKRDGFALSDFLDCARNFSFKRGRADDIVAEVTAAVKQWPRWAAEVGVGPEMMAQIENTHRLDILD